MLNFPPIGPGPPPQVGDLHPDPAVPGIPQWRWDGQKWAAVTGGAINEAPQDGNLYARRSGVWVPLNIPEIPEDVSILPVGGRLVRVNAATLRYIPFNGSWIRINGVDYPIPPGGISAGITGVFLNGVIQNLLGGAILYVYLFNNNGIPTIDYWDVNLGPHATSTTPGNAGTEIRVGDDSRTLVGLVRIGGDLTFWDSPQFRYTRSWLNRPVASLYNWSIVNVAGGFGYLPQISAQMVNWQRETVAVNLVSTWNSTAQPDVSLGASLNGAGLGGMSTSLMNLNRWHSLGYAVTFDLTEGFNSVESQVSVSSMDATGSLSLSATLAP